MGRARGMMAADAKKAAGLATGGVSSAIGKATDAADRATANDKAASDFRISENTKKSKMTVEQRTAYEEKMKKDKLKKEMSKKTGFMGMFGDTKQEAHDKAAAEEKAAMDGQDAAAAKKLANDAKVRKGMVGALSAVDTPNAATPTAKPPVVTGSVPTVENGALNEELSPLQQKIADRERQRKELKAQRTS
jgi:hypothetical protein